LGWGEKKAKTRSSLMTNAKCMGTVSKDYEKRVIEVPEDER